jgi:hypothetical protein
VSVRVTLAVLIALSLAAPAGAQIPLFIPIPRKAKPPEGPRSPPPDLPPAEAAVWPFPAPDPKTWWDDKRLKPTEASDPLGGRRVRRGERLVEPDNGVQPSTYRLWGLMPLQWQLVRGDEMILEVWTRPTNSVRQTVTRVIVRGADAFVQARAGLACCEAVIGRRVGFDEQLPAGSADRFRALARLPIWRSPRDVRVSEVGAADALCVEGTGYDVTLVTPGRSTTLHRACDPAEVGEIGDVLEAVLGAAVGHEPRIDVIFPRGVSFASAKRAHQALLAEGGRLRANPDARKTPPGDEPAPSAEVDAGVPASEAPPQTPPRS